MSEHKEVTREELKVSALLERIAQLESEKADLRVDLTIYSQEVARLNERVKELEPGEPQDEDSSE